MDPVTTAIVAAITTGVVGGSTKLGENMLVDAYEALKAAIKNKLGIDNPTSKAIDSLESKPDSAARKEVLSEEVIAAEIDKDPEILRAAQNVLNYAQSGNYNTQHIQNATGQFIAQADRGSTASVRVKRPKE